MNRQLRSTMLAVLLSLVLLVPAITGSAQAAQPGRGQPGPAVGLPESWQGIPGGSTGWWAAAQENIRQSEYQVTRQDQAVLADVGAAYQAPNRAHNLRTYFSPQGIRVIPRVLAGETPPWQWGVALSGYGEAGAVQPVPAASLHVEGNRVEYRRGALTEWYVNDARGLVQGFLLSAPRAAGSASQSSLVLESSLGGDLTARLSADGQAIDLTTPGGGRALRYGGLAAYDAAGRALPARLDLAAGVLRITLGVAGAAYPITVGSTITGLATDPAWTAEGDQDDALYGYSVGTAGDVNGDGYSDVIVGAPSYDTGQTAAGRAYVYHGSVEGLAADPAWTAESDQESAGLGEAVGTAGDVNGDGYSDVIVSAPSYDNDQVDEGQVYVFYGSAEGLAADPAWTAESDHYGCGFGSSAGMAGDVNGDGYSDVIVGAPEYDNDQTDEGQAFVYYGSADGLGADPDWTAESDQDDALFGESVGTAGDVNGDGYSDVIVGADYYDNDQEDEGRAYVYHGGAAGLAAEPAWTAESDQAYAQFGISVGTAGDVNGDGYSDIIVGAFYYNGGQNREGQAYVYHGSAIGLAADPAWTAEGNQTSALFGYAVRTAGDVNGDGYGDVIIGAYTYDNGQENEGRVYVYHGSPAGLATDPSWTAESNQDSALLGWSVGTAGDVNGDGYSDVIAGAVWYSNGQVYEGQAAVYHGGPMGLATDPAWTAEGDQDDALYGYSVGTAGDVNGDGYSDVIVGAPSYDTGQTAAGRAYVYHGSVEGLAADPAWTAESDQESAGLGEAVGTAGDVNGDGYSDVIVSAPSYDNDQVDEGQVYVFYGSAEGLAADPAWTAESDHYGCGFGSSAGMAGDVNGDGYSDVIVGAPEYDNDQTDEGQAFVYYGSADGLGADPDWTAESDQDDALFGESVGTAGDVNGDGYSDVIVGADYYDNDQEDEGRAYVYHGGAAGLAAEPAWTAESDQAYAQFGISVGTAGDVNGDGYSDIIVGAFYYNGGQNREGQAYVYHGSAIGLAADPAWTAEGNQTSALFGYAVRTAGDVNGDGYGDVIIGAYTYDNGQENEGRVYVYHGSPAGLATDPSWTAESNQDSALLGWSVGTAGDVNGDGYSDVIAGAVWYSNGQSAEGRAYVYYGNGGDGLDVLPRQMRADGSAPIAYLGMSDSRTAFQLRLTGRMPLGRDDVRLQWQVAPLGTPITATDVISGVSGWTDVLTTGVVISQDVAGLTLSTPYHWRVRLLYRPGNALGQPASRWLHIPWAGWNETDVRTNGNEPPIADAGPDQAVNRLALVTLDGRASADPGGDLPLTYLWMQAGGPPVTFTPGLSVTTFTAPGDPAVLTFTLAVTDSLGLPDPTPDVVVITVQPYHIYLPLVAR